MPDASVAIPVRNGGALFARVLEALSTQTLAHELIVCDSGSTDGSRELARAQGARVLEIAPERFSHGGTRNLLMRESSGAHVALLTQDAEPADPRWLERLLGGFGLAQSVGLAYGPYLPRPDASPAVRLELERWFGSLAPDGTPRVDRLDEHERPSTSAGESHAGPGPGPGSGLGLGPGPGSGRSLGPGPGPGPGSGSRPGSGSGSGSAGLPVVGLIGPRGFFTDANACIARSAWERVPFREVPYAEDRLLAIDMLRAGFAKAYIPDAAVLHSHAYTPAEELRRCFDEFRGLREVYGWREPAAPAHLFRRLRGELSWARRELDRTGASPSERRATLAAVTRHHVVRLAGSLLGSRADRLPARARSRLSLEGRGSFDPVDLSTR